MNSVRDPQGRLVVFDELIWRLHRAFDTYEPSPELDEAMRAVSAAELISPGKLSQDTEVYYAAAPVAGHSHIAVVVGFEGEGVGSFKVAYYVVRDRPHGVAREYQPHFRDFHFRYHENADVLYVRFPDCAKAINFETEDEVVARLDPDSGALVGIIVPNYVRRFGYPSQPQVRELLVRVAQGL